MTHLTNEPSNTAHWTTWPCLLEVCSSSTAPFIVPGTVHYGSCPLDGSVLTWEKCRTEMLHINFDHKDLI